MAMLITSLPSEIIDTILCYSDISFEDIINLRCVCKQFRWAAKTKEYCFLKKKFSQRWPTAKKYYDQQFKKNEQKELKGNDQENKKYLSFIKTGIDYVRQLRNINDTLQIMFEHNRLTIENNYIRIIDEPIFPLKLFDITRKNENDLKMFIFIDETKHLLTQPPRIGYDLPERYCYIKLFDYLIETWRNKTLAEFEKQSHTDEFLEQSATILAQQLQFGKNVFYSSIKALLDNIALEILNFLRVKHPDHLIFSTPTELFSYWKENNIDDNYWNEAEGIQIMYAITEYIFGNLSFQDIDTPELEYMCIDYVLKNNCGNKIILYIVFQSVARRLGLRCDIVTVCEPMFLPFRSHIKLFWFSEYTSIRILDNKKYKINRPYGGEIRFLRNNRFDKFPNWTIEKWFLWDFENSFYMKETFEKMLTTNISYEFYLYKKNNDFLDAGSVAVLSVLEDYVPKTRPQEVKFSVGMIVTHGDQSTDCSTGVIIGWHQAISDKTKIICGLGQNSISLNICSNFTATRQEIHYIILTKSKLCYVKEDDITLTKPNWIENRKIYFYFHKFENTHYVPNEILERVYPHDAAITAKTIFKN